MIEEPVIVTMKHMRFCRFCFKGVKVFFTRHGLDFDDFIDNGIAAEKLEQTQDSMAIQVAGVARGRK